MSVSILLSFLSIFTCGITSRNCWKLYDTGEVNRRSINYYYISRRMYKFAVKYYITGAAELQFLIEHDDSPRRVDRILMTLLYDRSIETDRHYIDLYRRVTCHHLSSYTQIDFSALRSLRLHQYSTSINNISSNNARSNRQTDRLPLIIRRILIRRKNM